MEGHSRSRRPRDHRRPRKAGRHRPSLGPTTSQHKMKGSGPRGIAGLRMKAQAAQAAAVNLHLGFKGLHLR